MNPTFWTVFKADLLFALCSMTVTVGVTVAVALFRKRKMKKMAVAKVGAAEGNKVFVFGGEIPKPGHCPLCGQGWAMPGPVKPEVPGPAAGP